MKNYRVFVLLVVAIVSLAGASFAETTSTAYLVTTSSSINDSIVHIINTSDTAQSFTGTLYNGDGDQLGAQNVALSNTTVAPQGRLTLDATDLENLFNVPPWVGPAMLEVTGSGDFKIMIKLKSPSGLISNTNCVTENTVHNIEGYETSDITYVRFINTGTSTINNITGTLYDKSGNVIGTPNRLLFSALYPKQQVWVDRWKLNEIFQQQWTNEASLVLSKHANLKLLNLNFVNSETFFNFSCFNDTDKHFMTLLDAQMAAVTGTLFLPESVNCMNWMVAIDNDTNGDNGFVYAALGTCVSGSEIHYLASNVPSGIYYVYAIVTNEIIDDDPQLSGYGGFYLTGINFPQGPNAIVPSSGTEDFDIYMEAIP